jgi:hypothetical protein
MAEKRPRNRPNKVEKSPDDTAAPLGLLAAALLALSPADRTRLAAMLLGQHAGQGEGTA